MGRYAVSQDPRFLNTNRWRSCWVHYADFYRCTHVREQLGKDTEVCGYFRNNFLQICPEGMIKKFDEQRAAKIFPSPVYRNSLRFIKILVILRTWNGWAKCSFAPKNRKSFIFVTLSHVQRKSSEQKIWRFCPSGLNKIETREKPWHRRLVRVGAQERGMESAGRGGQGARDQVPRVLPVPEVNLAHRRSKKSQCKIMRWCLNKILFVYHVQLKPQISKTSIYFKVRALSPWNGINSRVKKHILIESPFDWSSFPSDFLELRSSIFKLFCRFMRVN